jgi:hypothetical protein
MAEDHDTEEPDVTPEIPSGDRSTAPQSDYDTGQVLRGFGVLVVGLVLTFGIAVVL